VAPIGVMAIVLDAPQEQIGAAPELALDRLRQRLNADGGEAFFEIAAGYPKLRSPGEKAALQERQGGVRAHEAGDRRRQMQRQRARSEACRLRPGHYETIRAWGAKSSTATEMPPAPAPTPRPARGVQRARSTDPATGPHSAWPGRRDPAGPP